MLSNAHNINRSPIVKALNNTQEKLSLLYFNYIIFTSMESWGGGGNLINKCEHPLFYAQILKKLLSKCPQNLTVLSE